jgi:4-carboxymuconolactone decarboxylase
VGLGPGKPGWTPEQPQRLAGLEDADIPPASRAVLQAWWPPFNIHRVLARNPETLGSWIGFGTHILRDNRLDPRLRELCVLRVAWNARSDYEWGQHAGLWLRLGFPEADLPKIAEGADAAGWTALEAAALRGVDEMMTGYGVSDPVYAALAAELGPEALIDYVFLVAEFILVALTLNVFRIQPDPGLRPLPKLEEVAP